MSATNTKQSSKTNQSTSRRQGPREGSVVWAMIQVLDGKHTPMKPAEILEEIQKRGLAKKPSGKTPGASVAARLAVHVGIYFERPAKGKYQLKKGITAKLVASNSASKPASKATTRRTAADSKTGRRRKPTSKVRGPDSTSAATATTPSTEPIATEIATTS